MLNPFKRKKKFLSWNTYEKKRDFLEMFYFQQKTRLENVRNI